MIDPEIAINAVQNMIQRFRDDELVRAHLHTFKEHPNDMISDIVKRYFNYPRGETDHTISPDFMKNIVIHDDVLNVLPHVPNDSIHLTFTSPPYYNARDYSKYQYYEQYLGFLENVFTDIYRITKTGRFLVVNTSPVIIPRVSRKYSSRRYPIPFDIHDRLSKVGWEFIDDILWVKPEGAAKNRIAIFNQYRKPLTYKPNTCVEYLMVYRKKTPRLIDWNLQQYSDDVVQQSLVNTDLERSNVWYINPTRDKIHDAVFPDKLSERIIQLYSFIGDLIFDPFAGTGTVGRSAIDNNRFFFMVEQNHKYISRIVEKVGMTYVMDSDEFAKRKDVDYR